MSWGGPVRSKPFGLALSPSSSGSVSVRSARRFVSRRGPGSLTGSAIPSITLASAPASRAASIPWIISIAASICSSVIALMPPLCSICISLGTNIAQTFKYAAGDSRRTRLNTSRPCCCQSSARSSRKRLLNARRVASGEPPGFPECPDANLPLMRPLMTLGAALCSGSSIVFTWFSGGKVYHKSRPRSCISLVRPVCLLARWLGVLLDGGIGGGLTLRRKPLRAKAVADVGLTLYVFELIVGCHYSRDRQDFLPRQRRVEAQPTHGT